MLCEHFSEKGLNAWVEEKKIMKQTSLQENTFDFQNIRHLIHMKSRIILFFVLCTFMGFSQTTQKAKTILDQVSQKTRNYKSITADFHFIMDNNEVNLHEVSKGNLIVQGEAYKLNVSDVEIFCDGKTQWTYMKDADEVSISEANQSNENLINPATIFTIYEQGFTNNFLGEFTTDAKKTFKIEMIPDEVKEFKRVILEIDQTNFQILGAVMDGTDDNRYTIKVINMNTTVSYPSSTFLFDQAKHPKVNVIDMR